MERTDFLHAGANLGKLNNTINPYCCLLKNTNFSIKKKE